MQAKSFKMAPLPLLIWAMWPLPTAAAEARAVLLPQGMANPVYTPPRPWRVLPPLETVVATTVSPLPATVAVEKPPAEAQPTQVADIQAESVSNNEVGAPVAPPPVGMFLPQLMVMPARPVPALRPAPILVSPMATGPMPSPMPWMPPQAMMPAMPRMMPMQAPMQTAVMPMPAPPPMTQPTMPSNIPAPVWTAPAPQFAMPFGMPIPTPVAAASQPEPASAPAGSEAMPNPWLNAMPQVSPPALAEPSAGAMVAAPVALSPVVVTSVQPPARKRSAAFPATAAATEKPVLAMPPVSPQSESSPEVVMTIVDTPLAAAAAFEGSVSKVMEVANPQPTPVAVMNTPKAAPEAAQFDWKRILAIPLLVIGALVAFAIWGAKRIRAARSSGTSA